MEERLKSIEDKLDLIIASMSVNPEFEKYVKEGLLNLEIEKLTKKANENIVEWINSLDRLIIDDFRNNAHPIDIMESYGMRPIKGFASNYNTPPEVKQMIDYFEFEASKTKFKDSLNVIAFRDQIISDDNFCIEYQKRITRILGEKPNLEEEIEKLKQSKS